MEIIKRENYIAILSASFMSPQGVRKYDRLSELQAARLNLSEKGVRGFSQ